MSRRIEKWRIAVYVVLAVVAAIMLVPFVIVFFGAFKTQGEFISNPGGLLPNSFANIKNFVDLFTEKRFGTYFVNSLIVAFFAVAGNVLFGAAAGYALAKLRFPGKRVIFIAVVGGMMVPYTALFVPEYVVVVQLGLANTLSGIIIPIAAAPLSVFIMRQAALSVPDEIIEAARMDGGSELRIFTRFFLPLVGPSITTVAILSFLAAWNMFLWPLIVASSQDKFTLTVGLSVASEAASTTAFGLLLAGAVVILLPVLILFVSLQRYFVQGIASTGVK